MANRIWVVVNVTTGDLIYSSFSYGNAKQAFDRVKQVYRLDSHPGAALLDIALQRFDLNSAYAV